MFQKSDYLNNQSTINTLSIHVAPVSYVSSKEVLHAWIMCTSWTFTCRLSSSLQLFKEDRPRSKLTSHQLKIDSLWKWTYLHLSHMSLFSGGHNGTSAKVRKKSLSSSPSSWSAILHSSNGINRWASCFCDQFQNGQRIYPLVTVGSQVASRVETKWRPATSGTGVSIVFNSKMRPWFDLWRMKLHQVLTGATNTFDDKAAIDVGSVEDHPFTVTYIC